MKRQNVIVVISPTIEVWGNFKKLCEAKGFDVLPYHSLKSKPFPITTKIGLSTKCRFVKAIIWFDFQIMNIYKTNE